MAKTVVTKPIVAGDERWGLQDKLNQYRGIIRLQEIQKSHKNDQNLSLSMLQKDKITNLNTITMKYRQVLHEKDLGSRQVLRNALQGHRDLQLAYQNRTPVEIRENLKHANFVKCKELDHIRFQTRELQDKLVVLQDLLREQPPTDEYSIQEHELENKIHAVSLEHSSAASVEKYYTLMIGHFKRDSHKFDLVMSALKLDMLSQCKCVLRSIELGQLATEELDTVRTKYNKYESNVRINMKDREMTVKNLKTEIERRHYECRMMIRGESMSKFGHIEDTDKFYGKFLKQEVAKLEIDLNKLLIGLRIQNYDDIFPRLEEPIRQRYRLLRELERFEELRDDELNRHIPMESMLEMLRHEMGAETANSDEIITKLKELINDLNENVKIMRLTIEETGGRIVEVRTALMALTRTLAKVHTTPEGSMVSEEEITPTSSVVSFDDQLLVLPVPDRNPMVLLSTVDHKLRALLAALPPEEMFQGEVDAIAKAKYEASITESMYNKDKTDEDYNKAISQLIGELESSEEQDIVTREEIKLESVAIVEYFTNPQYLAEQSQKNKPKL